LTDSGIQGLGLFHELRPQQGRSFPALALSSMVHGAGIFALSYALLHAPVIKDPTASHYKVRQLELHQPDTAASQAAEAMYPTTPAAQAKQSRQAAAPADHTGKQSAPQKARAALPLSLPKGGQGKQTLIQPDIPTKQQMAQAAPLPAVLIWTPAVREKLHLTPPAPDRVTTAEAQTSLALPNEELQLESLPQRSVDRPTTLPTPPAGSTTPVAVKQPSEVKMAPVTVSSADQQPTPAAVLSVSDLKLKDGTVVLPPVNELKGEDHKPGMEQTPPPAAAKILGMGSPAQPSAAQPGAAPAKQAGPTVADAQTEAPGSAAAGESAEHIQRPVNGRFNVVVVGTSLADQYPETLEIWNDRVAYTAYLHVGTPKAWILQYAQLRSADAGTGGTVAHLDAPWPYDIVRPNLLSKDLNADALMIHGVLNVSGRLEQLAVAYPAAYLHASFVLRELAKWQFRPAQQLGKATPVEVLLIIPQDEN
jgi:hypothetical protein